MSGGQMQAVRATVATLALAFAVTACGRGDDAKFLASAKSYLDKGDTAAAIVELKNAVRAKPDQAEVRYLMGTAMRSVSDAAGAEVELRKALALGYAAEQVRPELAAALYESGQYDKAIAEAEPTGVVQAPALAALEAVKGDALGALGRIPEAKAAYDQALSHDPKNDRARLGHARLSVVAGDVPKAEALIADVLAGSPRSLDAWSLKAHVATTKGDADGARAAYEKAIEARPGAVLAYVGLVPLLVQSGKLEEASKRFAEMQKLAPGSPATAYADALLSYRKGDRARARSAIQAVLKVAPQDNRARLLGGAIEHDQGNYATAERLLEPVVKASPNDAYPRRLLASVYVKQGKPARAQETLAPLLQQGSVQPDVLLLSGEIALASRKPQEAADIARRVLDTQPKHLEAQLLVARARLALGQTEQAVAALEASAADHPERPNADLLLIDALIRFKQPDRARQVADRLVKRLPASPEAHHALGIVLGAQGDKSGARASFEKALAISPAHLGAAKDLAGLHLAAGNADAAVGVLRAVVEKDPTLPEAALLLVAVMAKSEAPVAEVLAVLDKAIAANGAFVGLRLAKTDYLMGRGDTKGALDSALAAQAAVPDDPAILYALGRAQQNARDASQALQTFMKLASAQPDSAVAQIGLAESLAAEKNWADARRALRRAAELAPTQAVAHIGLARVSLRAAEPREALDEARLVQKKWPQLSEGYLLEASAHAALKDGGSAEKVLRAGLAVTNDPGLLAALYEQLVDAGRREQADQDIATWTARKPDDVRALMAAGEVWQRRKDYAAAAGWYRKALAVRGNDPIVLNNLAWVLGELGDATALDLAKRALSQAPKNSAILDTIGSLNTRFGNLEEGLAQLQAAVDSAPYSATVRISLVKALAKAGKKFEALRQLQTASQLAPEGPLRDEVEALKRSL